MQRRLVEIADKPVDDSAPAPTTPTLEQFLSGLRTSWQEGEVRPTARPKEKAKRERRRPDPFAAVTDRLRTWFQDEPWRTSREFLERLQAEHPAIFPDGQLRRLQRRVKSWRRDVVHTMVFGTTRVDEQVQNNSADVVN